MTRINISDLRPKEEVNSTFCVKYLALMDAKDGKKYLNMVLTDATGDLESRVWNGAEDIFESVQKNDFVQVEGKLNLFQGRRQFVIGKLEKVEANEIDKSDFIVKAKVDPEIMYKELLLLVEGLTDVYIKKLLLNIIQDQEIARRLKLWQAGKSIHHAYQSGLLEHILSCANLAVTLSPVYQCNVNYVVAGAILHDICKIHELTDGMNVEYTEEGKLVGHLVKGVELVDRFSYRIENFPYNLKLHLKHILLSHHGEYEYGSPKIPQTSEAMLVHMIDLMDSKMHSFEAAKRSDNNTGHWTSYIKHLDRIVFKDELPFYPDFDAGENSIASAPKKETKTNKSQPKPAKELKQSLGSALKDFKVQKD